MVIRTCGCFYLVRLWFRTREGFANGCHRVLESLKAGKRLPEARFSNVKVAARGQGSVYGLSSGSGVAGGSLP